MTTVQNPDAVNNGDHHKTWDVLIPSGGDAENYLLAVFRNHGESKAATFARIASWPSFTTAPNDIKSLVLKGAIKKEADVKDAEISKTRRVRTPAGAKFFGLPIGSPITMDVRRALGEKHGRDKVTEMADRELAEDWPTGTKVVTTVYGINSRQDRVTGTVKGVKRGGLLVETAEFGMLSVEPDKVERVVSKGRLNWSPKQNWVDKVGGLPKYIEDIALALIRERGMPRERAIPVAINRVKLWAAGGGNVNPDTKAKAAKAVAEWEAKKARSKG